MRWVFSRTEKQKHHTSKVNLSPFFTLPHRITLLVAITVLSILFFIGFSNGLSAYINTQNQNTITYQEKNRRTLGRDIQKENNTLPIRLKIPTLGIEARIQHVRVSANGEMESPNNPAEVGWFAPGPRPGEKGNAVFAGHLNGENDIPGVFANLHKIQKGDMVLVENDQGSVSSFAVRETRTYNPGYAEEVFSRNDDAHLNLITCEGLWDETTQSYTERLVVFTDIVN